MEATFSLKPTKLTACCCPYLAVLVLQQVHYLVFYTAVVHIITGAIVLLLSTLKLK
jgi:hypothetical protein